MFVTTLREIYPDEPGVQYTADGGGLFVPSPWTTALDALQAARVGSGTRFLDLGSGDGRVVALAALLGADARGIECDAALHGRAVALAARVQAAFPAAHLTLRQGDLLQAEFAAEVLFYYAGGCVDRQRELYARLATVPRGTRVLILRTQRQPEIVLPLSALSQPPYFYLFSPED